MEIPEHMLRLFESARPYAHRITSLLLLFAAPAVAQQKPEPALDLGLGYTASQSLKASNGQGFWMQGGTLELGADAWRGLGIAAQIAGTHASSIGNSGIPLSLVTVTFGPRYRWHSGHRLSVYGEALVGEAHGLGSIFPNPAGQQSNANGLAFTTGGGIDWRWTSAISIRILDAAWLRTQLPNATNNVQNNVRLGAGAVFSFGHPSPVPDRGAQR